MAHGFGVCLWRVDFILRYLLLLLRLKWLVTGCRLRLSIDSLGLPGFPIVIFPEFLFPIRFINSIFLILSLVKLSANYSLQMPLLW